MVDLGGYVIVIVETTDRRIRLYGSPADRADLEVGDEILEVNGRSLDNCTHNEVISHIHQCIRSRTVCLRVRRRPRLGEQLCFFFLLRTPPSSCKDRTHACTCRA
ncbi:hypothetical protein MTO96_015695 [Rhipicephalus appendiculatus]